MSLTDTVGGRGVVCICHTSVICHISKDNDQKLKQ